MQKAILLKVAIRTPYLDLKASTTAAKTTGIFLSGWVVTLPGTKTPFLKEES